MPRTFIICAVASTLTAVTRAEATVKARHLLEIGDIRLVVDGERLHVEPFDGSWVERRRLAWQYHPITEARRQVLQAAGIGARL